jgi:hypothetical protein
MLVQCPTICQTDSTHFTYIRTLAMDPHVPGKRGNFLKAVHIKIVTNERREFGRSVTQHICFTYVFTKWKRMEE